MEYFPEHMPLRIISLFFLFFAAAAADVPDSRWLTHFSSGAEAFGHASDSLRKAGFRPVSMDLEGSPAHPRFTAAWTREPGPAWMVVPPSPESDFHDRVAALSRKGFRPIQISALDQSGSAPAGESGKEKSSEQRSPGTVYAAVLEKDSTFKTGKGAERPGDRILLGLDRARFQAVLDSARKTNSICAWVDIHGTPSHPLFSVLFRDNVEGTAWNYSIEIVKRRVG